ncbi:hypothetical protein Ddc_13989 [Ditylenchus destructor]|nr:hypothetical protein Ddc_13989 [Ditylenchus destructor]
MKTPKFPNTIHGTFFFLTLFYFVLFTQISASSEDDSNESSSDDTLSTSDENDSPVNSQYATGCGSMDYLCGKQQYSDLMDTYCPGSCDFPKRKPRPEPLCRPFKKLCKRIGLKKLMKTFCPITCGKKQNEQ